MKPNFVAGMDNVNKELYDNKDKLVLFVFTASWCGPCKMLKKELFNEESNEGICTEYANSLHVMYLDADEDENGELLQSYEVSSLPTQVLAKLDYTTDPGKATIKVIEKIEGCDIVKLRMVLQNNCQVVNTSVSS